MHLVKNKCIVILSDRFPPYSGGGIANSNYSLYLLLKKQGYHVFVITYLDIISKIDKSKQEENIYRFGPKSHELRIQLLTQRIKRKIYKWGKNKITDKGLAYQLNIVLKTKFGVKRVNKQLVKLNPDFLIIPDFGTPLYYLKKIPNAKYIYVSHHNPMRFIHNPLIGLHSELDAKNAIE